MNNMDYFFMKECLITTIITESLIIQAHNNETPLKVYIEIFSLLRGSSPYHHCKRQLQANRIGKRIYWDQIYLSSVGTIEFIFQQQPGTSTVDFDNTT